MTNEQLALYLKQIAQQVRRLSEDIEQYITEGLRQDQLVWVGEGPEPFLKLGKGFERQPVGRFVAAQMIEDFAETLELDAELLISNNQEEK